MNPGCTPFERRLAALVVGQVDFVTVGGAACALNGFVRTTDDVDILVASDRANVERLLAAWGPPAGELVPADFTDEEGAIRVIDEFPTNIFVRMGGRRLEDLRGHVRHIEMAGVPVPYLSAEGLILLKQGSVRVKDQMDVAQLQRMAKKPAD